MVNRFGKGRKVNEHKADPAFAALVAAVERFLVAGGLTAEANARALVASAQGRPYAPLRRATLAALARVELRRATDRLGPLEMNPEAVAPLH